MALLRRLSLCAGAGFLIYSFVDGCLIDKEPATRADVCRGYEELGSELRQFRVIDNAVFRKAGTLADLADRYEGPEDLSADAEKLDGISDSHTTTSLALRKASTRIADLCGAPLPLVGLLR
ncbi:molybdenum ABC transporter substrate-binding protein [Streptomyces apocyni]|uniref:molybdenum ABC transporter substrate-binding protein n=1 Tax=Streptomyces apocyni TaxID=2654677 RepID=UPI0012EAC93B|nr:molybdenum ABC transporter substrate-binding protein [Streptomyces apocyni]